MDEETKVIESAEKAENAEKSAEKKYSEEEMNGIVTRKSEKAVQKALKELGITDREKAKEVLKNAEKSGGQSTVQKNEGTTDELQKKLEERCRVLKNEAVDARIENAVLSAGVNSEKVKYAVRCIDRKACLDEDGEFSFEKANAAVAELIKAMPEFAGKKDDKAAVGFSIGADNDADKGNSGKTPVQKQKPWNRFN